MYRDYKKVLGKDYKDHHSEMEFSNPDWGSVAMTTKDLHLQAQGPPEDCKKELTVEDFIRQKWEREQMHLKKQLFLEDADEWSRYRITHENEYQHPFKKRLQYIGGVDISFVKGDNINACAAFVVLNFPELEVVHEDLSMVKLTAPYIPGFLAFREADFLVEKIKRLKETKPEIMPQVVLVDGNGILHPRGFGLASHLGVLTNLAMIGVAKNLLCVDGITRDEEHLKKIQSLQKGGDSFPLIGLSGKQHGVAYRSHDSSTNPVYISPGHKITVDTAVWVTEQCIKFRVPEPTRQADLRSREYLREHWETAESKPHEKKAKQKHRQKTKTHNKQENDRHSVKDEDRQYTSSSEEEYLNLTFYD